MSFTFKKTGIPEVILIETSTFSDERGLFSEIFKASVFSDNDVPTSFLQDNFSHSKKGVLRGLHYQLNPKAQGKLVRVLRGVVLDVAVDVRRASPTFLQHVSVELSESNGRMLYVPPGFAHGFVTLTDEVSFLYKCTAEYSLEHERGVRFDDHDINVDWGIKDPIVSTKDRALPFVKDAELF
jgi:dTDP-4-dehydrorhamnose 3,5-epimerase